MKLRILWNGLAGILLSGLVLLASFNAGSSAVADATKADKTNTFSSYEELTQYLKQNSEKYWYYTSQMRFVDDLIMEDAVMEDATPTTSSAMDDSNMLAPSSEGGGSGNANAQNQIAKEAAEFDFSGTNNQIQGVDEGDSVKTDGEYLYVVSNQKVTIFKAYPEKEAQKITSLAFSGQPKEIFINGDQLIVFGNGPEYDNMFLRQYNIANRAKPELIKEIVCSGYYNTARMLNQQIYAIVNAPVYKFDSTGQEERVVLPELTINGEKSAMNATQVHYFNNQDYAYNYTIVLSLDLTVTDKSGAGQVESKTFLTGASQNIFVSANNLYLTMAKKPDYTSFTQKLLNGLTTLAPANIAQTINEISNNEQLDDTIKIDQVSVLLEDYISTLDYQKAAVLEEKISQIYNQYWRDIEKDQGYTIIHKLALLKGQVEYSSQGEVNGQVLNQFSMDEWDGNFRIATTSQGYLANNSSTTRNNIYVLDEQMQVIGQLLGLAPNERIYSARFMGSRAYLVTFRETDPLFVADLTDPTRPKLLGKLKIPGYSDYLHPYDENHLIGIGREIATVQTVNNKVLSSTVSVDKGVKIALFEVSNPEKPQEVAKYVIDKNNVDSIARYDHRAVLFNKEKNLLVIPVSYGSYPIMPLVDFDSSSMMTEYQPLVWQGAYVFKVSAAEKTIKLRGQIEHQVNIASDLNYDPINRSLYIENTLYTISEKLLKLSGLSDLKELKSIAY